MTDIFIKSFNRAFYLDRCLHSVFHYVEGSYRITILDDGTPEKYLEKIQHKYPSVNITKSENWQKKQAAIAENLKFGTEISGFEIPTKMWFDAALDGSGYFIMTEDDVWFTEKINIDTLISEMKKNEISLLKLGWLGNFNDDKNIEISEISEFINSATPKGLILGKDWFMKAFFYNRYKLFTILYKLGIVDNNTRRKYWSLNSILMGLYRKEYWLQIWKAMEGKVDEKKQLINASVYYKKHKTIPNFIARMKGEVMKTTFQSSATNSYHQYGDQFDVNLFNHQINEAWFKGDFDALQNFPNDFAQDYFEQFLDGRINRNEFRNWIMKFKEQYRNLGCNVD